MCGAHGETGTIVHILAAEGCKRDQGLSNKKRLLAEKNAMVLQWILVNATMTVEVFLLSCYIRPYLDEIEI